MYNCVVCPIMEIPYTTFNFKPCHSEVNKSETIKNLQESLISRLYLNGNSKANKNELTKKLRENQTKSVNIIINSFDSMNKFVPVHESIAVRIAKCINKNTIEQINLYYNIKQDKTTVLQLF